MLPLVKFDIVNKGAVYLLLNMLDAELLLCNNQINIKDDSKLELIIQGLSLCLPYLINESNVQDGTEFY